MATLSAGQKLLIRSLWGQLISGRGDLMNLSKPDLDAAITAIDSWIDTNAASFNSALPVAARNGLTAAQKAELFYLVALKRYTT